MPVDKFGRMSDAKTSDTGISLTYINNNYIRSDGSTPVSGSIHMKGNTLYNVANPENCQDLATKEYADNRPHIIAVHASYHGPLIRGKYQFTFGGNESHNATTGFLIPHPVRVRKVKMRTQINKETFKEYDTFDLALGKVDKGFFSFKKTKITGDFNTIGKIMCAEAYQIHANDEGRFVYDFCFEDSLPLFSDFDAVVEEGDIIDILTKIDIDFPNPPKDFGIIPKVYIENTYLVTFLIELDPL